MTYAFSFDESACSGCKACQVACKDKNNLPLGVLWRRVYEVNGGKWIQVGGAWISTVFAYNLSIACNHCVHPKCAGVCPTDAFIVRSDGIVFIDQSKCIGCGYCAWACPYDAPQMDLAAGVMTKCNLCFDALDAGLPPACVAACPMRSLELVSVEEQGEKPSWLPLWKIPGEQHPFPLPVRSRTEPHLLIHPHQATQLIESGTVVANRQEITPSQPKISAMGEIPLLIFTLLAQTAIGAWWAGQILIHWMGNGATGSEYPWIVQLSVGICLAAAGMASFFHLRNPKNAWRAMNHLRKSWLSREILSVSTFAGFWAVLSAAQVFGLDLSSFRSVTIVITGLSGLAALYSMQKVYQLRSMPAWNTHRTMVEFLLTAAGLGTLLAGVLLPVATLPSLTSSIAWTSAVTAGTSLAVMLTLNKHKAGIVVRFRLALILLTLLASIVTALSPTLRAGGGLLALFGLTLVHEVLGRWIFFSNRTPGI